MTNIVMELSDPLSGFEMLQNKTNHDLSLRDKISVILRRFISSSHSVFLRMDERPLSIILRHFDASEPELIDCFIEEEQDIGLEERNST